MARTFLFVPGNRPDRFDKALDAGADVVVFDLEDAVAPHDKETARASVGTALLALEQPCAVRVNPAGTAWHRTDVEMVGEMGVDIMLPKCESGAQVLALAADAPVIALVETPLGIMAAADIATSERVVRLAFGSLDYAAALGVDPNNRRALDLARAQLVVASAVAGLAGPVDGVTTAVRDMELLAEDVAYGKALGFAGKLCIHPSQPERIASLLAPSDDECAWAARVLDAAASSDGAAVLVVDGKMVDRPVIRRAEQILSRTAVQS